MIVVDTNVLVYLYIRGGRTGQAEAVLARDPIWAAPVLWRSEFRNTLAGMVRQGGIQVDDALRVTREAERWMRGREYSVPSDLVLPLAAQSGCSAYDCEFAGLAQELGVPLVTADRQVLAAFPRTAVSLARFGV